MERNHLPRKNAKENSKLWEDQDEETTRKAELMNTVYLQRRGDYKNRSNDTRTVVVFYGQNLNINNRIYSSMKDVYNGGVDAYVAAHYVLGEIDANRIYNLVSNAGLISEGAKKKHERNVQRGANFSEISNYIKNQGVRLQINGINMIDTENKSTIEHAYFARGNLCVRFHDVKLASFYFELKNLLYTFNKSVAEKDGTMIWVEYFLNDEASELKSYLNDLLNFRIIKSFNSRPFAFSYTINENDSPVYITEPYADILHRERPNDNNGDDWARYVAERACKPGQFRVYTFLYEEMRWCEINNLRERKTKRPRDPASNNNQSAYGQNGRGGRGGNRGRGGHQGHYRDENRMDFNGANIDPNTQRLIRGYSQ